MRLTDGGKYEEHHAHPDRANNERLPAAVVLNDVQAIECGAEVDTIQNHLGYKGVVNACGAKDDGAVVELSHCQQDGLKTQLGQMCPVEASFKRVGQIL
jgi:hypothetical protein